MELLEKINKGCEELGLRYLVIGGHAVNINGILRSTDDFDLMVENTQIDHWRKLLESFGYRCYHRVSAFSQFDPPLSSMWRIDLMHVAPETFEKAVQDSVPGAVGGTNVVAASPRTLIMMKLHALKSGGPHRRDRDLGDIAKLYPVSGLTTEEFRALAEKYATIEVYDAAQAAIKNETESS